MNLCSGVAVRVEIGMKTHITEILLVDDFTIPNSLTRDNSSLSSLDSHVKETIFSLDVNGVLFFFYFFCDSCLFF